MLSTDLEPYRKCLIFLPDPNIALIEPGASSLALNVFVGPNKNRDIKDYHTGLYNLTTSYGWFLKQKFINLFTKIYHILTDTKSELKLIEMISKLDSV